MLILLNIKCSGTKLTDFYGLLKQVKIYNCLQFVRLVKQSIYNLASRLCDLKLR